MPASVSVTRATAMSLRLRKIRMDVVGRQSSVVGQTASPPATDQLTLSLGRCAKKTVQERSQSHLRPDDGLRPETDSEFSVRHRRRRFRLARSLERLHLAVLAAVGEIDSQADHKPD